MDEQESWRWIENTKFLRLWGFRVLTGSSSTAFL